MRFSKQQSSLYFYSNVWILNTRKIKNQRMADWTLILLFLNNKGTNFSYFSSSILNRVSSLVPKSILRQRSAPGLFRLLPYYCRSREAPYSSSLLEYRPKTRTSCLFRMSGNGRENSPRIKNGLLLILAIRVDVVPFNKQGMTRNPRKNLLGLAKYEKFNLGAIVRQGHPICIWKSRA